MNDKKTVVVTGASGGMGLELCERLAKDSVNLVLCSNDATALESQAKALRDKYSITILWQELDIADEMQVSSFFDKAIKEFGKLDTLVNLAGVSIPGQIESTSEKDYDTMIDVNVKGTFLASKYFSQQCSQDGLIINIGSMAATRANGNAPLYCTAKAAVNMLSQAMAIQMAEKNIRVTTLNPGGADTPFWGDRPINREKLLKAKNVVDVIMFVYNLDPSIAIHKIDFESFAMLKK